MKQPCNEILHIYLRSVLRPRWISEKTQKVPPTKLCSRIFKIFMLKINA